MKQTTTGRTYPPEIYAPEEVRCLLAASSNGGLSEIRNRAILELGYRGGLRLSEVLALQPVDVNFEARTVQVHHGADRRFRTGTLDEATCTVLQRWVQMRQLLGFTDQQPLFCTFKGGSLKGTYVSYFMTRLAREAGITRRMHFNGLRHTFAWELCRDRRPLRTIQQILGHANSDVTARYLARIAPNEFIESIRGPEPVLG